MTTNSKRTPSRRVFWSLLLSLPLALGLSHHARADDEDPPSRVARLAYEQGAVSFQPAGTEEWVPAPLNRPLTTGDTVWSDRDSRVELQLDGSLLRLSGQTAVSFLNLNDHITQIQLTSGTLIVRVRRLDDDETYEVDTPNLAFSILRPGLYRLSVGESGASTAIRVRAGEGEATGGGSAYAVHADEEDVFTGTDELAQDVEPYARGESPFDAWSADRDERWAHSLSARYVSPDVVGYEDLDDQGAWSPVADYGYVWFPRGVRPGWAPYHDGHWAYIAPWGYTWVDDAPWGFAPFHYGRWISVDGAWGWVPCPPHPEGERYVRPVYAPALVAWVGGGAGVGWFALGPREVYVPSYPVSRRYVHDVNVSNTRVNTTVVNNVYNTVIVNRSANTSNLGYVNRRVPGAVTVTSTAAFTSAQPVARNAIRFEPHAADGVRALAPAIVPTRQAVLGGGRVAGARPPPAVQARAVVARVAPPPPAPAFERRQQALQSAGGRPLSTTEVQRMQPSAAAARTPVRMAPPATLGTLHAPGGQARVETGAPPRLPATAAHPNDIPAAPRPPSPGIANSALERQHLQEQQQLRMQQDDERQRVQRQQDIEHQQLARQQADDARRQQLMQQLEQQHQVQTQALLEKHAQQQEQLQRQQLQQRQQQESQTKPAVRRPDHPPNGEQH